MALWNKLQTELDRFGRAAQSAFDEGKARLEILRVRQLADRAAQALGYAVYNARREGGDLDAETYARLSSTLAAHEAEAARLEAQMEAARTARADTMREGGEDGGAGEGSTDGGSANSAGGSGTAGGPGTAGSTTAAESTGSTTGAGTSTGTTTGGGAHHGVDPALGDMDTGRGPSTPGGTGAGGGSGTGQGGGYGGGTPPYSGPHGSGPSGGGPSSAGSW